jgi:hypothetical protein
MYLTVKLWREKAQVDREEGERREGMDLGNTRQWR